LRLSQQVVLLLLPGLLVLWVPLAPLDLLVLPDLLVLLALLVLLVLLVLPVL
jgi:hypothetical protein